MIVFLSSAARQRYADDVIRILALPQGGQLQLRYTENWLPADIRARIDNGHILDERGLVCFLADVTAKEPCAFEPVRFVRIIRAERIGSSYIFTIAADHFATGLADDLLRSAATTGDRARLPSPTRAADEIYAFTASLEPQRYQSLNFTAFEDTAARLAKHPPFATPATAFFTVRAVTRAPGLSWFYSARTRQGVAQGAYSLSTGRRFECEVYCLRLFEPKTGEVVPALSLVMAANDPAIQIASTPHTEIDSRYDVKRFQFATEPEAMTRVAGIRLFLRTDTDGENVERQDVSLPLVFGASPLWTGLRIALIGIGTAAPAMVAASASSSLSSGRVIAMIALGATAGLAAVFPTLKKP